METIGWPVGVNRIVLSDSSYGHNKNAVLTDKSENGSEMSRLTSSGCPDEWKVSMIFSNSRDDAFYKKQLQLVESGDKKRAYTEWETFVNWFKYKSLMGTIPFLFSRVGDSTDSESCLYRIKSDGMPSYTFNGNTVKVSMTWLEVFDDYISVGLDNPHLDSITAYNGYIELYYSSQPTSNPKKSDFTFKYGKDGSSMTETLGIEDFIYDGDKTCIFYFQPFSAKGVYSIMSEISFINSDHVWEKTTVVDRFEV